MAYKLTPDGNSVIRLEDGAFIPADPDNADWQTYQRWLSKGGVAEAALSAAELADQQCAHVDAVRDAKLSAGYVDAMTGKTYQTRPGSEDITHLTAIGSAAGLAIVMSAAQTFEIIAEDNSVVTLSAADAFALVQGRIMKWYSDTYLHGRDLKNQIKAGQTVDINAGWPT